MVWDEENRLRGINDNGRLHLYTYDHTGERALKSSAESSMAVINGLASAVITHTEDYTAYVSPYFVVQKGKFTKHFFEGATRVVSKLGEGTFSHKNTGIMAGGLDYLKRTQKEQEARDRYIKGLNVPPGPPTQHGIYATPEWMGKPYPSIDWEAISQNQEPPEGWPRYPKFNEPGDVPGPPVQFGPPVTNANVKAGYGFIPNGVEEKNLYYYHPDHLGSSSYITDREGQIIQHTEYIAFGETFVDEHSVNPTQPYLFNGKELDFETGLYYYGARYYDPKTSLWLNTDPLSGYNPIQETEHYIDGQHNGGIFNPMNMATYSYTYQNPVIYVDPNGKQNRYYEYLNQQLNSRIYTAKQNLVNKYNNVKNNVVQTGKNIQTWINNNKDTILKVSKGMQDVGDGVAVVGYGATVAGSAFAGVGALPGVKIAAVGNWVSTAGSVIELVVQLNDNDLKEAGSNVGFIVLGKVAEKGINKLLPGAGKKGVDVGKEFLKQSTGLKITLTQRAINKDSEQKKQKEQKNQNIKEK